MICIFAIVPLHLRVILVHLREQKIRKIKEMYYLVFSKMIKVLDKITSRKKRIDNALYEENRLLIQLACCIAVLGYPELEPSSDIASLLIDKSTPIRSDDASSLHHLSGLIVASSNFANPVVATSAIFLRRGNKKKNI